MSEPKVSLEIAQNLGLTPDEFSMIQQIMGRMPNFTELSIYSVMWSEHCSYKNSIKHLKTLPRSGKRLLVGAGEENAGLVDIGDGLGCAFKIESHNHPSAIEPYQGAATGVGGIHRDIFTMGARPIAALNSLRFGDPALAHTRHLVKGVVHGIGDYGNCLGVPTIGGEVFFNESYNQNILVNAMSVGIVKAGETVSAISEGTGNPVYIVGSATGKDGIHGATFASADLTEDSAQDLPAVQVGDPFQEKLLLEATLEAIQTGAIVGMQDMGAAGIICSTSEMSARSGAGMDVWLHKVPTRQKNMQPFEILLSESQERMLIVAHKGKGHLLQAIFDKWDLECEEIGIVTDTGRLCFFVEDDKVADVDADSLVLGGGAPIYERESRKPAYIDELAKFDITSIVEPSDYLAAAKQLSKSPNLVSKRWVFEQYDSMVRTNNLCTHFPSDAAVIRVKGTTKALAVSTDCNSTYVHADPYVGAMIAVSEAARNIVCAGGLPVAITNCLNFGNPYNPEVFYQFVEAIKGMGEACRALDTPVTGGNVSFYNQSVFKDRTEPIFPTPTIGMLGILDDVDDIMGLAFKMSGDLIYLIGESQNDIGSTEYLRQIHNIKASSTPKFDLKTEVALQSTVLKLIKTSLVETAHDVSDGGLFTNILESGMAGKLGFDIKVDSSIRKDAFLFGESQSRIVVSVNKANQNAFEAFLREHNQAFSSLGQVTEGEMLIDGETWGDISNWVPAYENTLGEILENEFAGA
ncbi:MAG: phosphoribosylformylglycinamidine synthase subunit PurL [Saprospiraceae bacterium]